MKRARNGTGCVYARKKRDGTVGWWFKFHVHGRPVARNANTTDRREAERQLAIALGEMNKGVPVVIRELTFRDAVDMVRAHREANGKTTSYHYDKYLVPYFGARTKMSAITAERIDQFVAARRRAGAKNGTINRSLTCLRRAFSLAMKRGRIHVKPHIEKLAEPPARSGFLSRADFQRVRDALPEHLGHVVTFAYITGWRLGEVLDLQWRNVDFEAGEVRIDAGATKNGDGRVFPMTSELRATLEARRAARRNAALSPWVFTRKNGSRIGSKKPAGTVIGKNRKASGKRGAFRKWWNRACVEAGVPGRLFHDLRRTAVRNLVRAGVPERVAMALSGHRTRSVFERYNIVSPGDLRAAAGRLEAFSYETVTQDSSDERHRSKTLSNPSTRP